MDSELQERAKALFDYLYEVVKLGQEVIRIVNEHDDFLCFQNELPLTDGIALFTCSNDDSSWLRIYKQVIPDTPELPENLENWVEIFTDPDKEPQIIEQRQIDGNTVDFREDTSRQDAFNNYLKIWERWAIEVRPKKKVQDLFTKLFHVCERLKYDEQLELIWGQGLLLWKQDRCTIKYPLITQRMLIGHNALEGIIQVSPPDDAELRLEFDALKDLDMPDLLEVKKHFKEIEYDPANPESYLDILKEIAGQLSTDGEVVSLSEVQNLAPANKLRIVDCWVLFVRKRCQDAIIRDIESFVAKLKTRELTLPDGFLSFLRDADKAPAKWAELKPRDEWSTLIDKQILFPLPANQEQIQILDRVERTNGIVVWGPPGTGKSHTIVNLMCHYMAEGKRVLVTTLKDQALTVLHGMIPDDLKPLCMSVLSNVPDSREKLEKAVASITEITQLQPQTLRREIEELENKIDKYRQELESIQKNLKDLTREQLQLIGKYDEPLLPAELGKKMQKDEKLHAWLKDEIPYEVKVIEFGGKDVIQIIAESPISGEEIEELKNLRKSVIRYLNDFSYELPKTTDLIDEITFRKAIEDLQKISRLEEDMNQYVPNLIFKDESDESLDKALEELKQGLETQKLICDDWQRSLLKTIRASSFEADHIKEAATRFNSYAKKVKDLYQKRGLLKNIKLFDGATFEDLRTFVSQAVASVGSGKKPWGFFGKKKQALKAIQINGKPPASIKDWETILHHIDLLLTIKDLRVHWNNFAKYIGAPEVNEAEEVIEQGQKDLLPLVEKLNAPIVYEEVCLPKIKVTLKRLILWDECVLSENSLENLFKALSIKRAQEHFRTSKTLLGRLGTNLQQIISRGRPHPVVNEMINCLNKISSRDASVVFKWNEAYQKVKTLNDLHNKYDRFNELLDRLKNAPNWAERWRNKDISESELCPSNWRESWKFQALKKYLQDISNTTQKISELENKQEKIIKALTHSKEKLVLAKTKLSLMQNTSEDHLQALRKWRLAVKKLGKGKGKWAWRKEKLVQQEMSRAKDAVSVWIMPLYKVSETIPTEFGSFDVVIVDEASQCDVRTFLALARGKKVIVVGDPEQISPEAVGIPEIEVQGLIKEFLVNKIPCAQYFDLKTSLYHLADITFSGQGTLMLKEHFRCVPEIIQFSNELCYRREIIPLRNPAPAQRLEPVLESVFVEGGYREGRQDINKPEARAICEKLKQMVENPSYKDKTFGVVSLTGHEQAKFIFNLIDVYLTTEQQETCKLRVGDAYTFQGDERDVMLLSMVVGSSDEKRLTALTSDVYRQRFNVAVSRARDKLILFHSVRLTDLRNPEDLRYKLLDFVQNGVSFKEREKGEVKHLFDSEFEEDVYEWLTKRGYHVTPQVHVGAKRIDLVVEGVTTRLGVECDGDRYHLPEKLWEDRIRQRQLERAGWTICRIWGSTFCLDPDSAMEPVLSKLKELKILPKTF